MKGILEFELPEDEESFTNAQKGSHYRYVIDDIDQLLRRVTKHGESLINSEKQATQIEIEMAQYIRNYIQQRLDDI